MTKKNPQSETDNNIKMKKNENHLSTLLDKTCDPNAKLSTEELHQIDFLLGDKQEDESVTQLMQQDWKENYTGFDDINYVRISNRMKKQMETNHNKQLSVTRFFYRSAAVLLLPLLGLSTYLLIQTIDTNQPVRSEVIAEILDSPRIQSRVVLPDGSIVALWDDSQLNLDANFLSGKTREVTLEGEAFFDIAHNPNKPFIIHAKGIRTTALGTAFTVRAVSGETSITVTVVEGKVKVEDGSNLLATLEANQQFIYGIETVHSQEKMIDVEKEDVEKEIVEKVAVEIDWQPHELIFRNMPFSDIVQDLAVRHNVNIVFESEYLKRQRIDALLDNRNSIDALLKFLCDLQYATYTVQGNTYTIKTNQK